MGHGAYSFQGYTRDTFGGWPFWLSGQVGHNQRENLSWEGTLLVEIYFCCMSKFFFILVVFLDELSGHFLYECSIRSLPDTISSTSFEHVIAGHICLGLHIDIFWTLFFIWPCSYVGNFIYCCTPSLFYSRSMKTAVRQAFWGYFVLFPELNQTPFLDACCNNDTFLLCFFLAVCFPFCYQSLNDVVDCIICVCLICMVAHANHIFLVIIIYTADITPCN